MFDGQLELSLTEVRSYGRLEGRHSRAHRAHWWFERMRQVVERAIDWEPAPVPRPEQIWFPTANRQVAALANGNTAVGGEAQAQRNAEERQICE
jgi:hypothetical protein